jgi:hypothetical protein
MADNINKDESQDKGNPLTRFLAEGLKASFADREYTPEQMKEIQSQGVKITKAKIAKTYNIYGRNPSDYVPSSRVLQEGKVAPLEGGGASFMFMLPSPESPETDAAQPSVLLPGGMGYLYVKPLLQAAEEFASLYTYKSQTGGPSILDLKEKLYQGRYMDPESYLSAIRPGTKNIIDPVTQRAIESMLNDVSVSNRQLLETPQGAGGNIQDWDDFLQTNYQQELKTGGSVNIPSDTKLNFAINNVFRTYYNRDATEVEAANLREQIKSNALASPAVESQYIDPVTGLTLDVTTGGFDEADIVNLITDSTKGKRSYWALKQFGDAFNQAMSQDMGSVADNLTEMLR